MYIHTYKSGRQNTPDFTTLNTPNLMGTAGSNLTVTIHSAPNQLTQCQRRTSTHRPSPSLRGQRSWADDVYFWCVCILYYGLLSNSLMARLWPDFRVEKAVSFGMFNVTKVFILLFRLLNLALAYQAAKWGYVGLMYLQRAVNRNCVNLESHLKSDIQWR